MIQYFQCKKTERLARKGYCDKKFRAFEQRATKRLRILDAAQSRYDLMRLRSNRFEALRGDRDGQYSIAINRQWRICFTWKEGDFWPNNVEIVDYH